MFADIIIIAAKRPWLSTADIAWLWIDLCVEEFPDLWILSSNLAGIATFIFLSWFLLFVHYCTQIVYYVRLLDTVVISGEDVWCTWSVVFGTLVCVSCFVLYGLSCWWHRLLVVHCGHQWTSGREWSVRPHFKWGLSVYVCGMVVMYVCVDCYVICGCVVSRRYIHVYHIYLFSDVNMYLNHLKSSSVCINSRMYVCCNK